MKSDENHYSLRNRCHFRRTAIRTVYRGVERISNLDPKTWNIIPENKISQEMGARKLTLQPVNVLRKWSRVVTKKNRSGTHILIHYSPKSIIGFC